MASNRNRWVPLSDGTGFVPLEEVIAANLDVLFPSAGITVNVFRLTRVLPGSQAGVTVSLNILVLCCLRPGVPGLSESIQVFSVLGRFLEHGRIYGFENDGAPEYFIGSADWMKRNLDRRVETIAAVTEPALIAEIEEILGVAENDNHSAWDLQSDGTYARRRPKKGEAARPSQQAFVNLVR